MNLSNEDYAVLNGIGVGFGAFAIFTAVCILSCVIYVYCKKPEQVKTIFQSYPTRILYLSLILSIPYSACYIWSSTPSAANQTICAFNITMIVLFLHLMNSTSLLIILHCAIILSGKDHIKALRWAKVTSIISVLFSFAFAFTGLFLHAYSYSEEQATCWIFLPDNPTVVIPLMLYKLEAAILYGPLFVSLALQIGLLIYCLFKLRVMRNVRSDRSFRRMVMRIAISPAFLVLHCLMIFGGDLPITYYSRSAMYACFIIGFAGYGSFGLCYAVCVVFVDPALGTCWREFRQNGKRESLEHGTGTSEDTTEETEINVKQGPKWSDDEAGAKAQKVVSAVK